MQRPRGLCEEQATVAEEPGQQGLPCRPPLHWKLQWKPASCASGLTDSYKPHEKVFADAIASRCTEG